MKSILKRLLNAKEEMGGAQNEFEETLKNRFPNLVERDLAVTEDKIENELEFLLSSAIIIKSGRIKIPAPGFRWQKEMVLTRKPGLKGAYDSYRAFSLLNVCKIKENGDIERILKYDGDVGLVELSVLKSHKHIDQEKLQEWYDLLREGLNWKSKWKKFENPEEREDHKVGRNRIRVSGQNFEILLQVSSKTDSETVSLVELTIPEIKQFEVPYQNRAPRELKFLEKFWKEYEQFEVVLLELEEQKGKLLKNGEELIEKIKEVNKAFRVLEQLKQV